MINNVISMFAVVDDIIAVLSVSIIKGIHVGVETIIGENIFSIESIH